jgi:hypothetical protein
MQGSAALLDKRREHDSSSCGAPARIGAISTAYVQQHGQLASPRVATAGLLLMSGRHGRGVPDDRDHQAAVDMEAASTVTIIQGLRSRLRRQEILEHPKVINALRGFQSQIEEQLAHADQNPGRHRSTVSSAASQQINDASGFDLKPDPLTAKSPAEFVEVLAKYRFWSGNPSWRTIAIRSNHIVVHSTIYTAMNSNTLPKFDVMKAIIIGCGGDEEDLKAYASAWRRIGSLIPSS